MRAIIFIVAAWALLAIVGYLAVLAGRRDTDLSRRDLFAPRCRRCGASLVSSDVARCRTQNWDCGA